MYIVTKSSLVQMKNYRVFPSSRIAQVFVLFCVYFLFRIQLLLGQLAQIPQPAITIVLPIWNGLPHLHAALKSLAEQDVESFELIIVDDGSTDGSAAVVERWLSRAPPTIFVKLVVHQVNRGLPAALNRYG